ncbi:MAG: hypothetical protein ACFFA6_13905 [Promethearchaeota archaeon]
MLIRCPECEEKFSYGRKICHICKDNSIFFGKIFQEDKRDYKWNCNIAMTCYSLLTTELESIESRIGDISKINQAEMKEQKEYDWNCKPTEKIFDEIDKEEEFLLIYE